MGTFPEDFEQFRNVMPTLAGLQWPAYFFAMRRRFSPTARTPALGASLAFACMWNVYMLSTAALVEKEALKGFGMRLTDRNILGIRSNLKNINKSSAPASSSSAAGSSSAAASENSKATVTVQTKLSDYTKLRQGLPLDLVPSVRCTASSTSAPQRMPVEPGMAVNFSLAMMHLDMALNNCPQSLSAGAFKFVLTSVVTSQRKTLSANRAPEGASALKALKWQEFFDKETQYLVLASLAQVYKIILNCSESGEFFSDNDGARLYLYKKIVHYLCGSAENGGTPTFDFYEGTQSNYGAHRHIGKQGLLEVVGYTQQFLKVWKKYDEDGEGLDSWVAGRSANLPPFCHRRVLPTRCSTTGVSYTEAYDPNVRIDHQDKFQDTNSSALWPRYGADAYLAKYGPVSAQKSPAAVVVPFFGPLVLIPGQNGTEKIPFRLGIYQGLSTVNRLCNFPM
jgi:hypothetical protein